VAYRQRVQNFAFAPCTPAAAAISRRRTWRTVWATSFRCAGVACGRRRSFSAR